MLTKNPKNKKVIGSTFVSAKQYKEKEKHFPSICAFSHFRSDECHLCIKASNVK